MNYPELAESETHAVWLAGVDHLIDGGANPFLAVTDTDPRTTVNTVECAGCGHRVKRYDAVIRGTVAHGRLHWHRTCYVKVPRPDQGGLTGA